MSMLPGTPKVPESAVSEHVHVPELDGVRGLAILMVLLSHGVNFIGTLSTQWRWGVLTLRYLLPGAGGVDIFFALSGFLITGILLRNGNRPHSFRNFYGRRIVRIFPIYYIFLAFTFVLSHFWPDFRSSLPRTHLEKLSFALYIQNWPIFWANWGGLTSIWGAYWSLAVEEQFYMVWPAVIRFVNSTAMLYLCIAGFVAGWFERFYMIQLHGLSFGIMQWPFSRLDGLFLGAAIALYRHRYGRPVPLAWGYTIFGVGVFLLVNLFVRYPNEMGGKGFHYWTTGPTLFSLLGGGLIAMLQHKPRVLSRIFTLRPLVAAGTYSYGMYVYHLFILTLLKHTLRHVPQGRFYLILGLWPTVVWLIVFIAMTAAVAMLSFRFIETPFLRLKRYFPSAPPAI